MILASHPAPLSFLRTPFFLYLRFLPSCVLADGPPTTPNLVLCHATGFGLESRAPPPCQHSSLVLTLQPHLISIPVPWSPALALGQWEGTSHFPFPLPHSLTGPLLRPQTLRRPHFPTCLILVLIATAQAGMRAKAWARTWGRWAGSARKASELG